MPEVCNFEEIFSKILAVRSKISVARAALQEICRILVDRVPHYNWVGFYLVDSKRSKELILGPFEGAPTEHVRIPFGAGICGQAAEKRKIFVVPDVERESNYLACSPDVKSEIVLPIFKGERLLGELDIDSHTTAAFTPADQAFLQEICQLSAEWLEQLNELI